jgi:hypothetical protein
LLIASGEPGPWDSLKPNSWPLVEGEGGGIVVVAAATTAFGAEVALVEPTVFVAFTMTRSVWPWSEVVSRRFDAVAPEIATQVAPALSQLCH